MFVVRMNTSFLLVMYIEYNAVTQEIHYTRSLQCVKSLPHLKFYVDVPSNLFVLSFPTRDEYFEFYSAYCMSKIVYTVKMHINYSLRFLDYFSVTIVQFTFYLTSLFKISMNDTILIS